MGGAANTSKTVIQANEPPRKHTPGLVNKQIPSRGRLLYIVNDAAFFLSHRLPIARAARADGFEVHVATPLSPSVDLVKAEGFFFHPIPMSRKGINLFTELRTLVAIVRLYRRMRPDIVHTVTIKPVIYGGIAARVARVPAVISAVPGLGHVFIARGVRASIRRFLVKTAYRVALRQRKGKVILQNPDDCTAFIQSGLVSEQATVLIKGSGVDMKRFVPQSEPQGKPVVLFASRMLWDKGVGKFVEAVQILCRDGVDARFVLAGESDPGNPAAVPKYRLQSWHDSKVVEWWGQREDMPAVFASTNIVCLPTYYGEGVPKVLIEAAACGRPIVTTDTPGCREIVRHDENGLLVPVRNAEALATALRRLIENPILRHRMGKRGREIAEKEFSVEKVVNETMEVYRKLLA